VNRDDAFDKWFGPYAFESDGGLAKSIWDAGWDTALLIAAYRIEQMKSGGDTAQSFGAYLRNMKEE
jgi:hypothetical protein